MTKLLKKITLVSTTAFLPCITTTTTTNLPTISIETEEENSQKDMVQDNNTAEEEKHELQPLGDKDKPDKDVTELLDMHYKYLLLFLLPNVLFLLSENPLS